jgi:hypothetical protein
MRYERYVGTRESECWRAVVEDVLYGYRARDAEVERLVSEAIAKEWVEIHRWKPFLHFCDEWDGLLIDRDCPEFDCCGCYERDTNGKPIARQALRGDGGRG